MRNTSSLKRAVKLALGITAAAGAGALLVSSQPAMAQSSQTGAKANNASGSSSTKLSKILVTGSHIPRTAIAKANPTITISRNEIQATGYNTLGEVLQHLPQMGPMTLSQTSSTGNTYVNLHYLGATRTLVLVNGQRWTTTLSGGVNLGTIPTAIIQRIEILMDGASAIYGSDAIAGVINVITTKNYQGAQATAYDGMYDANGDGGGWDGRTQQYSFTAGISDDRGSLLFSGGYFRQDPIWANNRSLTSGPAYGFSGSVVQQNESDYTPGGHMVLYTPNGTPALPGCGPSDAYGMPGCNINGPFVGPNANPHAYSIADNYNQRSNEYTFTNFLERWHLYTQGHYDLTNNVSFNFMSTYQRENENAIYGAAQGVGIGTYGATAANGLKVGVSATNPYNPFGADLVPYFSGSQGFNQWCARYGTGGNGNCSSNYGVLLNYHFRPLGVNGNSVLPFEWNHQRRTLYFNGGFNGYFYLANNEWQWSAHYIYAETEQPYRESGWISTPNLNQLQADLGPVSACKVQPSCTPVDIFGGGLTPSMVSSLNVPLYDMVDTVMRDYNGNVGGQFFNSWYAGPWGAAAGYEYEDLTGYSQPNPLAQRSLAYTATYGGENTTAEYAELNIPLAHNLPFAKSASIDIANRWSQFKWSGIGANLNSVLQHNISGHRAANNTASSTGRVAIKWQPIESLLFRATWAQGFRTPSISELFDGVRVENRLSYVQDPCADNQGPTVGCPSGVPSSSYVGMHPIDGGNVNLQPEKATSRSAGFVYSPKWVPGLEINADYFKTEITHQITTLGSQYYLNACYYAGNPDACQHIIRGSNGALSQVVNLRTNSGSYKVEGWDVGLRYKFPTTPFGDFKFGSEASFPWEAVSCRKTTSNGAPSSYCLNGKGSSGIVHRYKFWLDWNYGPWEADWTTEVIGPQWEDCSSSYYLYNVVPLSQWCSKPNAKSSGSNGTAVGLNRMGSTVYNDIYASYTVDAWNATFALGVNNVFNKQPPLCRSCYMNYMENIYRIPGRFFYGRVTVHF